MIVDKSCVGGEQLGVSNTTQIRRGFVASLSAELRPASDPTVHFSVEVHAGPTAFFTIDLVVAADHTMKCYTLPVNLEPGEDLSVSVTRLDSVGDESNVRVILGVMDTDRMVSVERDNVPMYQLLA